MRKLLFILAVIKAMSAYATGGFYAGIGAGYASINNSPLSGFSFNNGSQSNQTGGSPAVSVYGGYDFNRVIGVQLGYSIPFNTQVAGSYNVNQQLVDLTALIHLPFGIFADALSGFSLYAKGGVGYSVFGFSNVQPSCPTCVNPPGNAYAFVPVYGFGAEYGFTNMGIRFEWENTGSVTAPNNGNNQVLASSNMYLLSILYHF